MKDYPPIILTDSSILFAYYSSILFAYYSQQDNYSKLRCSHGQVFVGT